VKNLNTARKTFQLLKMVLKAAGSEIQSEIGQEALDKLQNYQKMFEEPEPEPAPIPEEDANEADDEAEDDENEDEDEDEEENEEEEEEEEELDLAYLFPGMRQNQRTHYEGNDDDDNENCTNCSILYGKLQQADEKLQEAREHIALLSKTCMVIADLLDEDKGKVVKKLLPMWTRHFLPFLEEDSDESDA
jgi:ribosomal protein L12E/L44/L45/RPP1/RPP2